MFMSDVARTGAHRRNCEKLGEHARAVGMVVEQLRAADLGRRLPAAEEPLIRLEAALKRANELVGSCTYKSFLYTLAMGWSLVYQFREVHDEIHRCLTLFFPFISLLHQFRMQSLKEALEAVERDKREYTLDDEDLESHRVVLKPDRTQKDADVLENSLSRRYPDLGFNDALQEEKEKLIIELQRSRTSNDTDQCRVIEHLIGLTENIVNVFTSKKVEKLLSNEPAYVVSGYITNVDFGLKTDYEVDSQWKADLFGCCREPCLSLKTFLYPCGTFSWIANVVSEGKISREQAVNNVIAYSVLGGCFCYTCCFRKKLRRLLNIEGSSCDDFFTHLMCCCCAMVQERRELQLRNFHGCQGRKMIPPPSQYMTS